MSLLQFAKTTAKAQTTYTFRETARKLVVEFRAARRHRRATIKARSFAGQRGLKLNIGCGPNQKPGWINIDSEYPGALQIDAREPFPFDDESVDFVYSEHFFEHLVYPFEAQRFLAESLRVLVPGGTFSLGVPDCEPFLSAYVTHDERFYQELFQFHQPEWCRQTRMGLVNYIFRLADNDHKYAYDEETMTATLVSAGFTYVARRVFNSRTRFGDSPVGHALHDGQ